MVGDNLAIEATKLVFHSFVYCDSSSPGLP